MEEGQKSGRGGRRDVTRSSIQRCGNAVGRGARRRGVQKARRERLLVVVGGALERVGGGLGLVLVDFGDGRYERARGGGLGGIPAGRRREMGIVCRRWVARVHEREKERGHNSRRVGRSVADMKSGRVTSLNH